MANGRALAAGSLFLSIGLIGLIATGSVLLSSPNKGEGGNEKAGTKPSWCAPGFTCLDPNGRGILLDVPSGATRLHAMSERVCVPTRDHGVELTTDYERIRPVYVVGADSKTNAGSAIRFEERDNYKGIPTGAAGGDVIPIPTYMWERVVVSKTWPSSGEHFVREFHQKNESTPKGQCYLVALHPEDVAARAVQVRLSAVDLDTVRR